MPDMELRIELRSPSSVESIDVAMDGLPITVWAQCFTRRQAHEIGLALQTVDGASEVGLLVDSTTVRGLFDPRPEWQNPKGLQYKSAHHREQSDEEDAFEQDGVHMCGEYYVTAGELVSDGGTERGWDWSFELLSLQG